jgi:hypothetical protein
VPFISLQIAFLSHNSVVGQSSWLIPQFGYGEENCHKHGYADIALVF